MQHQHMQHQQMQQQQMRMQPQPGMMQPGMMQPGMQPGMMRPGMQPGMMQPQMQPPSAQFNRWAQPGSNYQTMSGFQNVDYSAGWNPNVHDQMLKNNINQVFMKHDTNRNGQLDPHEFYPAYSELCLRMGMAPPRSQQDVQSAFAQFDANRDGMISSMEMLVAFKNMQGINSGMQMQPGMPQMF